jgi:hypothetical protein
MIKIRDMEIDFDATAPQDLLKLKNAEDNLKAETERIKEPAADTSDPRYRDEIIEFLNGLLQAYGNFLDDFLGDGVANELLGKKPSLVKVLEVNDELSEAIETFNNDIGERFKKYQPNRATRRRR